MKKRTTLIGSHAKKSRKRAQRKSLSSLHFFVDLLNAKSPQDLSRWEAASIERDGPFEPDEPSEAQPCMGPSVAALWPMRDELRDDLACITDRLAGSKPRERLASLLEKINGLERQPCWNVWPAKEHLFFDNYAVRNPGWDLGRGRRIIKVGQQRLIVAHGFNDGLDPKRYLYGMVASALEGGKLQHLKRCQNCRRYFLRENLRRRVYCTDICRKADDAHLAPQRVKTWRQTRANSERRLLREEQIVPSALGDTIVRALGHPGEAGIE